MSLLSGWNSVPTVYFCFLMEARQTTHIFLSNMPILKQCGETEMNETEKWNIIVDYFPLFLSFEKLLYHCINQEPNVGF